MSVVKRLFVLGKPQSLEARCEIGNLIIKYDGKISHLVGGQSDGKYTEMSFELEGSDELFAQIIEHDAVRGIYLGNITPSSYSNPKVLANVKRWNGSSRY